MSDFAAETEAALKSAADAVGNSFSGSASTATATAAAAATSGQSRSASSTNTSNNNNGKSHTYNNSWQGTTTGGSPKRGSGYGQRNPAQRGSPGSARTPEFA